MSYLDVLNALSTKQIQLFLSPTSGKLKNDRSKDFILFEGDLADQKAIDAKISVHFMASDLGYL